MKHFGRAARMRGPPSSLALVALQAFGVLLRYTISPLLGHLMAPAAHRKMVISYRIPHKSGGGEISGVNEEDQFIMGLLRSSADAVLFGSGTLHGDSGHVRIPEFIYPQLRDDFRSF